MTLEHELQALTAGKKSRRLELLWPRIEQKLAEGASHADILGLLNRHGFDLTRGTYKSYVQRLRKRQEQSAATTKGRLTSANDSRREEPRARTEQPVQRPRTFNYDPVLSNNSNEVRSRLMA